MARAYRKQGACPIARSMSLLGDRWTMLVVRDIVLRNRRRFSDLLDSLEGVSPRVLSQRLKLLEEHGVVERTLYNEHPPRMEYQPTAKGEALRPVLMSIYEWGEEHEPRTRKAAATDETVAR